MREEHERRPVQLRPEPATRKPEIENQPVDSEFEQEAELIAGQIVNDDPARVAWSGDRPARRVSGNIQRSPALSAAGDIVPTPGMPLHRTIREPMERRLGHSFSNVRVHTGEAADRSARMLGARAFTSGSDIVFRAGAWSPGTSEGQRLLAHELVHVVQQQPPGVIQREPEPATAPPPSAEREAVEKALVSKDPGDVKDIKNVNAATDDEKHSLIRILVYQGWVGPRDEYKIEELWASFGDRLPDAMRVDPILWTDSINAGAELMKLPQVQQALIDFMNDVKLLAIDYMKQNRQYVANEIESLGLKAEEPSPEQNRQLMLVQSAAGEILKVWDYQDKLRRIHCGYYYMGQGSDKSGQQPTIPTKVQYLFDPDTPPQMNLDKDEKDGQRDWLRVKSFWDPVQGYLNNLINHFPALYAVLQQNAAQASMLDRLSGTEPHDKGPMVDLGAEQDPAKARSILLDSLTRTLTLIDDGQVKVMSDRPHYRDMTPLHAQLLTGMAPSLFSQRVWRDPFNQWVVQQDLQNLRDEEFYKQLGVQTLGAAAFVFLNFATAGTATFAIVAAASITASGMRAYDSMQTFIDLENAARTNVQDSTRIVDKATVVEAGQQAMSDIRMFLELVTTAGFRTAEGMMQKQSEARKPVSPAQPPVHGVSWKETEVRQHLENSPDGREAIEIQKKHNVNVVYNDDVNAAGQKEMGSFYDPDTNTVTISRHLTPEEASLVYIHEMGHAEYRQTGASASLQVRKMGSDQYVRAMCMEEAVVESRAIRARLEVNRFGEFQAGASDHEKVYVRGSNEAMRAARAANPNLSEEFIRQKGHMGGEIALYKEFLSGNIRSSVDMQVLIGGKWQTVSNPSYPDYYRNEWATKNLPIGGSL